MTKSQAIEVCVKALQRRHGHTEDVSRASPKQADMAADLVAVLEAMGLFTPDRFA